MLAGEMDVGHSQVHSSVAPPLWYEQSYVN